MTTELNSTLSWLDSSESERRAIMELVSALSEQGTLDELGIGSVRDTIAEFLFPGTSTIQTRARYFLFIPWILQRVEATQGGNSDRLARELQLTLCDALDRYHGVGAGVIGRQARGALRRWPSSIYWVGLERWGIRREVAGRAPFEGGRRGRSSLRQVTWAPADPVEDLGYESGDKESGRWAKLPPPPEDFPERASFDLTPEEGRFLRDCIELRHPQSYLAHILRVGQASAIWEAPYPWEHFSAESTAPALAAWLDDAKLFSLVHQGAAVLYNVMLAEFLEHDDTFDKYSNDLAEWFTEIQENRDELARWDRAAMWRRLRSSNPRLRTASIVFADRWYTLAMELTRPPLHHEENREARRLVRERELTLKGLRARLTYREARDITRGYPTSARLDFRWSAARQIAADILEPLE